MTLGQCPQLPECAPLKGKHLRVTSHMSQEMWPCNGEDPWLSSKGHTMVVGKVVLCSHGPSSIVWSENGPCCGIIAYLLAGKEGKIWFNTICLKLYQFERITWWCLFALESVTEIALQFVLKSIMLENTLKKSQSPKICTRPTSWEVGWRKFRETMKSHP